MLAKLLALIPVIPPSIYFIMAGIGSVLTDIEANRGHVGRQVASLTIFVGMTLLLISAMFDSIRSNVLLFQ